MTNNTTRDQIIALFPDNADNEISAADMRVYVDAIFNDKEVNIVKIQYIANLAASNSTIYEGSIVVIWGDENAYNGLYLSKVNQPTVISELIKLSGLVENPEDAVNPLMTYDYIEVSPPIAITSESYVPVAQLTTPPRVAGRYELKMSMIFNYNSISRPAWFRWSEDGGNTWIELNEEPKDANNKLVKTFIHVEEWGSGIKDIQVEAKCGSGSGSGNDTLTILDMAIIYQRVA